MADFSEEKPEAPSGSGDQEGLMILECPICLQPCIHPVELPCRHVFCFLCIKGVAMQGPNSKCAICRATIPSSVLTNPQLKDVSQLYKEPKLANGYQWYYESRSGGWWQYDERTMNDLEREFSSNKQTCQLLLAGHLYVVDFVQMIQYRLNNRNVSRRIRREINLEKRGVAGIRITGNNTGSGSSGGTNNSSPPPASFQQGSGSSNRRRRGNTSASNGTQPPPTSNHSASTLNNSSPLLPSSRPQNVLNQIVNNDPAEVHTSDSDDDSVDEDEDYDSDYSDADEDMELGEEEEALIGDDSDERETEDEEDYEARDGARAPTRRSDRSNSSNNQTPPPPSGSVAGTSSRTYSPNSNGRGSRSTRSGRSSGSGRSSNGTNGTSSRSVPLGSSETISLVSASHGSASSNFLTQAYKYTGVDSTKTISISNSNNNNNFYSPLDRIGIGQVSGPLSSITNTTASIKITFERSNQQSREEYL